MVARAGIQQPGGALLFGDCPSRGRLEDRTSFHGKAFLCGDFVCVCWWAGALTANSAAGSAVRGSSSPRRSVELAPARARPRLLAAENPGHPLRRQGTADQRRVKCPGAGVSGPALCRPLAGFRKFVADLCSVSRPASKIPMDIQKICNFRD